MVDVVSICLYDELFLGFFFFGGGRGGGNVFKGD